MGDWGSLLTKKDKIVFRAILIIGLAISPIGIFFIGFPEIITKTNFFLLTVGSITFSLTLISMRYSLYFWVDENIKPLLKKTKSIVGKLKGKLKGRKEKKKALLILEEKLEKLEDEIEKSEKEIEERKKEFLITILSESLERLLQISLILLFIHYLSFSLSIKYFTLSLVIAFMISFTIEITTAWGKKKIMNSQLKEFDKMVDNL